MSEKILTALAQFIIAVISSSGYWGVALLMGIESMCIPLPSEIIMPFAGYLVHTGKLNLIGVATAGALGCNLGEHGIRVNAVEPGWVMTNMSAPLMEDPAAVKYYNDRIALHRGAQPNELAATIAYLLSPDASYVTAATLLVDGGFIVNAEL